MGVASTAVRSRASSMGPLPAMLRVFLAVFV